MGQRQEIAERARPALETLGATDGSLYQEVRRCLAMPELDSKTRELVRHFQKLCASMNYVRREETAHALARIEHPAIKSALSQSLRDPDERLRQMAVAGLAKINDPPSVAEVVDALRCDPSAHVRVYAAYVLGRIGNSTPVSALLTALRERNESVGKMAAHSLGKIADRPTVDQLLALLSDDPSTHVRANSAYALGGVHDSTPVPGLLAALRHDSWSSVRKEAAVALGRIRDSVAIPALLQALHDWKEDVRAAAARALAHFEDPAAVPGLLAALRDDRSPRVRANAAFALGPIGGPSMEPALRAALENPSDRVCIGVALALQYLDNPAIVQKLLAALHEHPSSRVRRGMADVLAVYDDPAAIPGLLDALEHEQDAAVRRAICFAVGVLGATAASRAKAAVAAAAKAVSACDALRVQILPALQCVRESDSSVMVRLQADQAMQALGLERGVEFDGKVTLPALSGSMRAETAVACKQLRTFCLIGEILRRNRTDTFVVSAMRRQLLELHALPLGDSTLRNHLSRVRTIFEKHLPELGLLMDQGQGQRGFTMTLQGWTAWRIAMETLGRDPQASQIGPL